MSKFNHWSKLILIGIILLIFGILNGYLVSIYSWYGLMIIPIYIIIFALIYYFTKNPFLGLLSVIFCLPFERIPSIDIGMITLKINQFLGILLIISWMLGQMFQEKKITPNALVWPLSFFLLAGFLSIFGAEFQSRAIQVFVFVFFTAMLFFATVSLVNSRERFELIIKVLYWSTLITCFFALFQFAADMLGLGSITGLKEGYGKETMGFTRVQAFSQEPLYLANYLFLPLGIFVGLYLEKIKLISRMKLLSIICLILLVILLTVSRGAYIGLIAFFGFVICILAHRVFTIKHIITGIVSIIFVICATVLIIKFASPDAYGEFIKHVKVEDFQKGESTQARLTAWYDAYEAFEEKPIFGIGLGNFGPWVKNYPDPSTVKGWDIVNNEYLEVLAETGIVGFIAFLIFLLVIAVRSFIAYFKTKDNFNRAILVGLIAASAAIFVQYNFFSTLYIIHIWITLGLLVAMQNIILINNHKSKK